MQKTSHHPTYDPLNDICLRENDDGDAGVDTQVSPIIARVIMFGPVNMPAGSMLHPIQVMLFPGADPMIPFGAFLSMLDTPMLFDQAVKFMIGNFTTSNPI
jgi:hypothetical protein